jgi:hypothetical protein
MSGLWILVFAANIIWFLRIAPNSFWQTFLNPDLNGFSGWMDKKMIFKSPQIAPDFHRLLIYSNLIICENLG